MESAVRIYGIGALGGLQVLGLNGRRNV